MSEEQLRMNIADICSLYIYGERSGLGRIGMYPFSQLSTHARSSASRGAVRE
jgi:hypothetical protein